MLFFGVRFLNDHLLNFPDLLAVEPWTVKRGCQFCRLEWVVHCGSGAARTACHQYSYILRDDGEVFTDLPAPIFSGGIYEYSACGVLLCKVC